MFAERWWLLGHVVGCRANNTRATLLFTGGCVTLRYRRRLLWLSHINYGYRLSLVIGLSHEHVGEVVTGGGCRHCEHHYVMNTVTAVY